jgi:hypothetical protein
VVLTWIPGGSGDCYLKLSITYDVTLSGIVPFGVFEITPNWLKSAPKHDIGMAGVSQYIGGTPCRYGRSLTLRSI